MNFQRFLDELAYQLDQGVPGYEAQKKMAPYDRSSKKDWPRSELQTKSASVLVLFYPKHEEPHLVFIKRPAYLGVHSRQVSFPGGRVESKDESMIETALREANEELGIDPDQVEQIGYLSKLYIPPSRYWVQPVVGALEDEPQFQPDEREVDEVLEVPVKRFFDPEIRQLKPVPASQQQKRKVPCFFIEDETIWGATAMILSELLELLSKTSAFKT